MHLKILLLGHRGQVGSAILQALPPTYSVVAPDIDITDDAQLREIIISNSPDIMINAAAYTHVDAAEDHSEEVFLTNAHAPRVMAEMAYAHNIRLIHYSTDYVFGDDNPHPRTETDSPHPLNIYGQSKLAGEQYIRESGCRHLIFRTSWVYGTNAQNFITKIIDLSRTRDEIQVISDQIGAPTSARFIAAATYHALEQTHRNGLYHLCCSGETSWADYARLVIETVPPIQNCRVIPVLSKDYPQKAKRPHNSRLNIEKFINDFDITPPDWRTECIAHLKNSHATDQ